MGSGIGGLQSIELNHNNLNDRGFKKVSPFFVPGSIVNMTWDLSLLNMVLRGQMLYSYCLFIWQSLYRLAARSIAYGDADIMIAGGSEMASTPLGIAGFLASKALSKTLILNQLRVHGIRIETVLFYLMVLELLF